jgi:predicted acyltransferase (DUF342 family)
MTNPFFFARIIQQSRKTASQAVALIKGPQGQQASVTGDLTARKIDSKGAVSIEGKGKLWYITRCHLWDAPKENAGFVKTQCSSLLLEHPFFFHQQNRE